MRIKRKNNSMHTYTKTKLHYKPEPIQKTNITSAVKIKGLGSTLLKKKQKKHTHLGGCNPEYHRYFKQHAYGKSKCSPIFQEQNIPHLQKNSFNNTVKNSCLENEVIFKLVKAYNNHFPNNKIMIQKNNPTLMYQHLNRALQNNCGDKNEVCWVKQPFAKDEFSKELLEFNFKPLMPKDWYCDKVKWLNTLDIDNVLFQYQQKYPEFVSIGPTPIDFDYKLNKTKCVTNELCNINLKKLIKQGKKYIGVVFNLDPHTEGGSHWIAMFCNIPKKTINYWDSYGYKPPKEVNILMNRLKNQGNRLTDHYTRMIYSNNRIIKEKYGIHKDNKFVIKINPNRHQYKNSECGVYCINFIVSMLEGKTFESITKNVIRDDETNALRSKYFNPV